MSKSTDDSLDPQLTTLIGRQAVPKGIAEALRRPNGARFYKCALQVNPFAYTRRHAKPTKYKTEDEYNTAIVASCRKEGVEVVGITDHFRIATSQSLAAALRATDIDVLVGFEAVSSDGVHILCLFPAATSAHEMERIIGACGVTDLEAESPQSDKACVQLLEFIPKQGGIAIAAHACSNGGGRLATLKGQTRARVWTDPDLLSIGLPGARSEAPEGGRDIIANKDASRSARRQCLPSSNSDTESPHRS